MVSFGPPGPLQLSRDTVDLWCVDLDAPPIDQDQLARWLQADEQQRAARLRRERDRKRFTIGRGLLRAILARYMQVGPGTLRFTYGVYGKPALANLAWSVPIHFNFAHSNNLGVLAVGLGPVGVDVEVIHPLPDLAGLIARYLAPPEQLALAALDDHARLEAFYRIWTRKEAWLKLGGEGLTWDPTQIAVSHDAPARLLWVAATDGALSNWSLLNLDLSRRSPITTTEPATITASGALAVRGPAPTLLWRSVGDLRG